MSVIQVVKALVCFEITQLFAAVKQKKRAEMNLSQDPGNPHLQVKTSSRNSIQGALSG